MNIFQKVFQVISRLITGGRDSSLKDLGTNSAFREAVNDIKADIAKQNSIIQTENAAAKADRDASDGLLKNAKKLENSANNLERPVTPVNEGSGQAKGGSNRIFKFVAGGALGIALIAGIILGLNRFHPASATPTTPASSQSSGPQAGSLMAWVDGSTLVFVNDPKGTDNNGQKGFWITLNAVSNHQYSLCARSGKCIPWKESNQTESDSPTLEWAGPGGSDPSSGYCTWIDGHNPTDADMSEFGILIGMLKFNASFTGGVHCIVDHPQPRPSYSQTSPYYDPSTSMADMQIKVSKTNSFCQNGQAFETLDLIVPPGHSIQGLNGSGGITCQLLTGSNRLVCGGSSNLSSRVNVPVPCVGHGSVDCQPGSILGPAGCNNNLHGAPGGIPGLSGWGLDANGAFYPLNGHQSADSGWRGPVLNGFVIQNGVMVAESLPGNGAPGNGVPINGLPYNGAPVNGLPVNGAPTNGQNNTATPTSAGAGSCGAGADNMCPFGYTCDAQGNCVPPPQIQDRCPTGYYLSCTNPSDPTTCSCVSMGPSVPTCLDGYQFDTASLTCRSIKPDGEYPGCPSGQIYDPSTGTCDPNTSILSATQVIHNESISVNLPDCTPKKQSGGGSCQLSPQACGQKKFDPTTCTCY